MGIFDNIKALVGTDKKPQQPIETINPLSPKKILIVEDEQLLGDALEFKLKQAGFAVTRAANGQEGLEKAQAGSPDLILLDIIMPIMNGKLMLRTLRTIPEFKTTPVVVLTNAGDVENIKEMVDYSNAYDFLVKSNVSPDEILKKVQEILSNSAFH